MQGGEQTWCKFVRDKKAFLPEWLAKKAAGQVKHLDPGTSEIGFILPAHVQVHGVVEAPSKAALLDVVDKAAAFAKISEDRQARLLPRTAQSTPKLWDAAPTSLSGQDAAPCQVKSLEPPGQEAQDAAASDLAPKGKLESPTEEPMGYMSEVRAADSLSAVHSRSLRNYSDCNLDLSSSTNSSSMD